jgi:hypothetical protein
MSVTLSDKRNSYSTVKNWVAGFGTGYLSTEDELINFYMIWSEFLAIDPEARVRFPALPEK